MAVLDLLNAIRDNAGDRYTVGLPDDVIERFAEQDPALARAIAEAHATQVALHGDPQESPTAQRPSR